MDLLPDDIVLEIFRHVDIDTFFAARCVSKRIYELTNTRMISFALAVAQGAFPGQSRILIRRQNEVPGIAWLNALRYRQLAAILLECFDWRTFDLVRDERLYLCADDPLGDPLREKLELGLNVVADISNIVRHVKQMPTDSIRRQNIPPEVSFCTDTTDRAMLEIRRECKIMEYLEYYIWDLCAEDLQGIRYLLDALLQDKTFWYDGKSKGFDSEADDCDFELSSWAAWHFMKMGPSVFWTMWWANRDSKVSHQNANRMLGMSSSRESQKHQDCRVRSVSQTAYLFLQCGAKPSKKLASRDAAHSHEHDTRSIPRLEISDHATLRRTTTSVGKR